jgi:hypothetical protein
VSQTSIISASSGTTITENDPADEAAIRSAIADYNAALNAVLPLYADDGISMPPYSDSALGKHAVRVDETEEGGYKQSGIGRLNGASALDDSLEYRTIIQDVEL